jgi:hypothetical protein
MSGLGKDLAKAVGSPAAYCIEYGMSLESWLVSMLIYIYIYIGSVVELSVMLYRFTTLQAQVDKACKIIAANQEINGKEVSVVGLSQGNLVARGVIQVWRAQVPLSLKDMLLLISYVLMTSNVMQ